jgi:uncharacterized protein YyaL (SSP411 family)
MANRLKDSTSSYLLQHAQNPVDWYPWGPEALEKALTENKPIFLSIGYSACHWCHVMERESFESTRTAEIMNKLFVNIKVDREERPDIDAIYLKAVVLMTGHGGWPTSVWLTPDLKPFYGGTYFPPAPRHGQPSFAQVLLSLALAWRDKREEITTSAQELLDAVARLSELAEPPSPTADDWLDKAVSLCIAQHDDQAGGFGGAPKFPQAMTLRFLLLQAVANQDKELLELVDHSCEAMARGGIYDQLGGGFHRYSVDSHWTVPHFEKMLYDNALLLGLYADLVAHTGKPLYRWIVETLVAWLGREMTLPEGGFASSTDADSEGEEGKFFVWTPQDLALVLDDDERRLFTAYYEITPDGNFEDGQTVLTQKQPLERVAKALGWNLERAVAVLDSARAKALQARQRRMAPARDDKAAASWNAQTVSSLCRAARQAGIVEAQELALRAGRFLKDHFSSPGPHGELCRLVSVGQAQGIAQAEDVGSLVLAFFDLYELTLEDEWLAAALALHERLLKDYWDDNKALTAMTTPRSVDIPLRPFSFEDNATPSAQSLLLECARRHYRLTGDERSRTIWEKAMAAVAPLAQRAPTGLGLALQSAALFQAAGQELILGGSTEQAAGFLAAVQGRFVPNLLVARAESPGLDVALAQGKEAGKAYLCSGSSCQPPVTDVDALQDQLSSVVVTG